MPNVNYGYGSGQSRIPGGARGSAGFFFLLCFFLTAFRRWPIALVSPSTLFTPVVPIILGLVLDLIDLFVSWEFLTFVVRLNLIGDVFLDVLVTAFFMNSSLRSDVVALAWVSSLGGENKLLAFLICFIFFFTLFAFTFFGSSSILCWGGACPSAAICKEINIEYCKKVGKPT